MLRKALRVVKARIESFSRHCLFPYGRSVRASSLSAGSLKSRDHIRFEYQGPFPNSFESLY